MMLTPEHQIGWRKRITWTLISAGGWFLACSGGATLAGVLQLAFFAPTGKVTEIGSTGLTAIICGAIGGWCQWLLLRHRMKHANAWIIATVVGWIVGALLAEAITGWFPVQFNVILLLTIMSLFQGIGQWCIIRRELGGLWWWPLATTSSGVVGGFIWQAVFDALNEGVRLATLNDPFADESRSIGAVMSAAQATAVTGIVIGLITGIALSVLITRLDISHQTATPNHSDR